MTQLYIMAFVTTVIALLLFGMLYRQFAIPGQGQKIWPLFMLGLLMSPAAYFLVRLPIINYLEPRWFANEPAETLSPSAVKLPTVRDLVRLSYAPLTEEPAKLLPWLIFLFLGAVTKPTRAEAAGLALAVGASFAIGEIWLVAYLISVKPDPALLELPWYAFGGFASERIATCFAHTLFALPTLVLARRGLRWAIVGLGLGMLLHASGNAPILFSRYEMFGISKMTWNVILQVWLVLFVLGSLVGLVACKFGTEMLQRIWQNQIVCPECGVTYRQPLVMGLNMGTWRYEPCGACGKWHWVTLKNLAPLNVKRDENSQNRI
jgi:hypothetical protein